MGLTLLHCSSGRWCPGPCGSWRPGVLASAWGRGAGCQAVSASTSAGMLAAHLKWLLMKLWRAARLPQPSPS